MKKIYGISIIVIILLTGGNVVNAQLFTENALKFGRALALIESFYVDSARQEQLTEKAIIAMLRELDPHSVYLSEEEVKASNEELEGNFDGIGIQFNILYDSIIVISPVPGGPSEKAGLRSGDRIVTIEDEDVAGTGITTTGVRNRLLGERGTLVNVGIYRRGVKGITTYTIKRDKIPVNSLDAAFMIAGDVGFIKLNRFAATSEEEFLKAVDQLQKRDMKNLIIDLRGNSGGYLEAAIRLTDQIFNSRKLIVYLEGLKTPRQEYFSKSGGALAGARIVVLVDEGSASASEILAGALQDWDRGVVVGRRSFGKGLVQNGFYFSDGSAMRLTIARYFTPTGRLIQSPYEGGIDKYVENYFSRFSHGELFYADSIAFPDSLKYNTLTNNRSVYGGGGIMPDVFVPADTTWFSDYYASLVRKNVITEFALDYVDSNRERLIQRYPDFNSFRERFKFTDKEIMMLTSKAESAGIPFNESQFEISGDQIIKIVTGLVARDLWNMSEYYEIVYATDRTVEEALKLIQDTERYNRVLGIQ
ncbi:MAG: S41 family peptidase [Bacteroidales bacterium]